MGLDIIARAAAGAAANSATAAQTTAAAANTAAGSALATANAAQTTADGIATTAGDALVAANEAVTAANAAQVTAGAAQTTANGIATTANDALAAAEAAVTTASAAQVAASSAQASAGSVATTASDALTAANAAVAAAGSAQTTANTAQTSAAAAEATANGIATTANDALASASNAVSTANAAQSTANGIATTATDALTAASAAVTTANAAQSTASAAQASADSVATTAADALTAANSAVTTATAAQTTATAAQATADGIATTANDALTAANAATTTANAAQTTATGAASAAASAQTAANAAQATADGAQTTATGAATDAASALTAASGATATANDALTAANAATTTANAAQATATGAASAAASAQTAANAAQATANGAQTTASGAATDAASALTAASGAATTASAAQTTANAAQTAASAAQSTADGVAATASSALTTANSAAADASQALASAMPADLFVNLGTHTIATGVNAIVSSGYDALGKGVGTYVSDALATAALASAHPRFCKQSANGRYFRLVPTSPDKAISVAQGGATGTPGTNDQPAIQATVAYACATGCNWVEFPLARYELWCPVRTTTIFTHAIDGHPITITSNSGLGLRGIVGGTTLTLKNSLGGSKNTITQTVDAVGWQGGGIYVLPGATWPSGGSIDWVAFENLVVDGGVTYNPADRSNTNITDKGLWVQDIACSRIRMRNCTFRNFAGEIYYVGGSVIDSQVVEHCTFDGSPQSALNPSSTGTFLGIEVEAGNSYQAAEVMGGLSFTLVGGRLYDFYSSGVTGGPDPSTPAGYPFTYATRRTDKRPPWVTFHNTRVEGAVDGLYLGSWVQGRIVTVDNRIALNYMVGHLRDINLTIEAWCDLNSNYAALDVAGPPTTTTQVLGGPVGAYYTPPSNIDIRVICKRTALAKANNRFISAAVNLMPGLYDKTTLQFTVSGEANTVFSVAGGQPAGFAVPRIVPLNFTSTSQPYGGTYDYPSADKSYDVAWAAAALFPATGSWNITLGNTYGYTDGQKVIFYHGDATLGKTVVFPANGAGLKLQRDRKLYSLGDLLELRYDGFLNKWVEERYITATQLNFSASVTYDAPNIAAGSLATTNITVLGASLGDQITAMSFGVSLQGLIANAYVSAANTVTVSLYNPTGAAVNLASTTVAVTVSRK